MAHGKFADNVFPGAVFGRLTVVERLPREKGKHRYHYRVLCRCECGGESRPEISNLTGGLTTSCGCRKREVGAENSRGRMVPGQGYASILPGAVFGRLTVIRRLDGTGRHPKALCRCECGKKTKPGIDALISGNTKSCGCLAKEVTTERNKRTASRNRFSARFPMTYRTWCGVRARCCNPKSRSYETYGAKGVRMCAYLKESPQNLKDLIGKHPKEGMTIDRFPIHNGNYSCGQCEECKENGWELNIRWATRKEQANNMGDYNVKVTAFGRTMNISQWRDETGIDDEAIRKRLKRGWTPERAVSVPGKKDVRKA